MADVQNPKKRAVKGSRVTKTSSESSNAKANGKRGRPRVDTQDESAAERRRTQIRLAQRAYRERKETTISDLEKRVAEMQRVLEEVQTVVTGFRDKAIEFDVSQWNPVLGLYVEEMNHRVTALVEGRDPESDSPFQADPDQNTEQPDLAPQNPLEPIFGTSQESWLPVDQLQPPPPVTNPLGYTFTYENSLEHSSNSGLETESAEPVSQALMRSKPSASNAPGSQFANGQPMSIPTELKPVYTYSFQETSFARRLTRQSYERTYHMLTNPHTPPEKMHRLLRYSLCFGSVKTIAERVRMKLLRSRDEPLESWDVPNLYPNGAGLHFPRDEQNGGTAMITRNMGPFQISNASDPAPSQYYPYEIAKWIGMEGVWYDSHDVEAFLTSRGLVLDGSSSTATMEIEEGRMPTLEAEASSPNSTSTVSLSSPESPISPDVQMQEFFAPEVEEMLASLPRVYDMDAPTSLDEVQGPDSISKQHDVATDASMQMPALPRQPRRANKRTIVIDVDRLIDSLNEKTICLGRSPGYNKEHVMKTFEAAIMEAY